MRAILNALIVRILLVTLSSVASAQTLDPEFLRLVNNATFEVVVKKTTNDPLTYEKPLPLNLLPFRERNDKYQSIGSAFAIGDNKYVSAQHVISLDAETQLGEFFLRDADGNVYELDNVYAYSTRRDFIVFDLKKKINSHHFNINQKPELNSKIFAAGNAHGEGIIVRDGLLTSKTEEEINGEWKWLRFSAAASPGNSGGPLLDEKGMVIGVVLRKSESENLNYALPISEIINHQQNTAHIAGRVTFRLDVANFETIDMRDDSVTLPLNYRKLNSVLAKMEQKYYDHLFALYLTEHGKKMFPLNTEASPVLYETSSANFPYVVSRNNDDGTWSLFGPKKIDRANLGYNGYLQYGGMGSFDYVRLQRPDNVNEEMFYADSKLFMDLFLKGYPLTRNVAGQEIRITSLGKAQVDESYKDKYNRLWIVRNWIIPFSDQVIITYSLPVPGGASVVMRIASTGSAYGLNSDIKFLTNFIYQTYYGTLEKWQTFMAMKKILPEPLTKIKLDVQYGKYFSYDSNRLSFKYASDVMTVSEKSDMHLMLSYFEDEAKKIVWDISGVTIGDDINSNTYLNIARKTNPPISYGDKFARDWNNAVKKRIPYNNTAIIDNRKTYIGTAFIDDIVDSSLHPALPFLYTVTYGVDGTENEKQLQDKLAQFTKGLKIVEKVE